MQPHQQVHSREVDPSGASEPSTKVASASNHELDEIRGRQIKILSRESKDHRSNEQQLRQD